MPGFAEAEHFQSYACAKNLEEVNISTVCAILSRPSGALPLN